MSVPISPDQVQDLVQKAQDGETKAFGKLYDYFADAIFKYILIRVRNHADAQDLTADVFKKTWEYLDRYKRHNFRAFLYTVAHNLVMDHFRGRSKDKRASELPDFEDPNQDVEKQFIKKQEFKRLHQAIAGLPESYKEIIILRFIEELSIKETSAVLNRSSLSIRVAQYKAIKRLKQLLS